MMRPILLALAFLAALCAPAAAHKASDSYLSLETAAQGVVGRWDMALRDLDHALGLDGDGDGRITWGELRARHDALGAYALAHLRLSAGATPCALTPTGHLVVRHSDGAYAVLEFTADCPLSAGELHVAYDLFFALDPSHRGLVKLTHEGAVRTAVLSPSRPDWRIDLGGPADWRRFADYLIEGVWHIWIGFDHVLFLLSLLLPAALVRRDGRWQAAADFRGPALSVVKVVTAFTVAHSITLSLASLELIALPSRLVESAIAASVAAAALNNVFPVVTRRLWLVAFGFGLVHGLGFASVLADLGLPAGALILALLGFNLGVELGQLAIVAALLPAAFALRGWLAFPRYALPLGSLAVAALAGLWLVERAFDVTLAVG